jgi:hypothetical protein
LHLSGLQGFALMLLFPTDLHSVDWQPLHPTDVRQGIGTVHRAMFTSFEMMMGSFNAPLLNDAYSPMLAWTVFFLFILIVNIVMLNL